MKKKLSMPLLVVLGLSITWTARSQPVNPPTLHLISAAATQDLTLSRGAQSNRTAILSTMSAIANALHMRFNGGGNLTIIDENFNCRNIRKAIENLAPAEDDVVVFYYSGHGGRSDSDPSPFPTLSCNDPNDPATAHEPGLNLREVGNNLLQRRVRLALVIADACNYPQEDLEQFSAAAMATAQTAAYRRLFLETSGMVMISSASPGEFAWYTAEGGRFTNQFIEALKDPGGGLTGATWESFLEKVLKPIAITSSKPVFVTGFPRPVLRSGQTVYQTPQAFLRITRIPQ